MKSLIPLLKSFHFRQLTAIVLLQISLIVSINWFGAYSPPQLITKPLTPEATSYEVNKTSEEPDAESETVKDYADKAQEAAKNLDEATQRVDETTEVLKRGETQVTTDTEKIETARQKAKDKLKSLAEEARSPQPSDPKTQKVLENFQS